MALTVNWATQPWLITIPQSDLTLVSGTRYQITVNELWTLLRDFSDGPEGSARPITYRRFAATASTPAITEINDPFYACEFEDGAYSVDIIDGNSNFRDVEVKNTVSVGTNNTTGFINPTFLELSLFQGFVCVDPINGVAGTGKTGAGAVIGTRTTPSSNMTDALAIALERGIAAFNCITDTVVSTGDFSAGYTFQADNLTTTVTFSPAAEVSNCTATNCTVAGELDGFNRIFSAEVGAVTDVSGQIENSDLESTIAINGDTRLLSCYSGIAATGYPKVTSIGSDELIVRDMRGSIGLADMTGGAHSIGVYGGRIIIEASCTGGSVYARGDPYEITDLSGGAVTVIDQTANAKTTRVHSLLDVIEGSYDHAQVMRLLLSAQAGILSGADTTNVKIRDLADIKDRIDATVDASGNRTAVTLDPD